MDYEYEILSRETCFEGFFKLERYRLRHSLFAGGWGEPISRELLDKGRAAAVIMYDPDADSVVLIEQFRVGALGRVGGAWLLELVAGFVEPGETMEEVVRREALEEAGCEILELAEIGTFILSPGSSSETISLFCARVKAPEPGEIHGLQEEGEDIRVHVLSLAQAVGELYTGRVDSATPIIGLQWLQLHRDEMRARWG